MKLEAYHPYRTRVFWVVFLLSAGLALIASVTVYVYLSREQLSHTQDDLQSIAERTAQLVPVQTHEALQKPDDQKSDGYKTIEAVFHSVMAGNPKIDDIYTLRPTHYPHLMTFVVSGKDTADYNHNGVIDDNEVKADLGTTYDTSSQPALEAALTSSGHDNAITYDKWGAWMSGYAPLKDANGKTIAVLGVDYAATSITSGNGLLFTVLWRVYVAMIPLFLFCAFYLSRRIEKPFRTMAHAMEKITHGEPDYQIPVKHSHEEKLLAEFFNNMKQVLWESAKHHNRPPDEYKNE